MEKIGPNADTGEGNGTTMARQRDDLHSFINSTPPRRLALSELTLLLVFRANPSGRAKPTA
jgi:hypothetical protein